ncbi:MAG: HAMP domain-containing protein [Burkholderiaceae bacterium]|nr:HAMP domain-containing protein [Burkholderiaceae bacterium]
MSRALRYGLLAALAVGGVLLFLLASASGNTAFFERNYPLLLGINGVIAALLFVLVLALIRRLVRRLRAKQFGARMMMRFTVAFALMGVLPGVLIYIVSTQFLSRSIESWFDVRVERALDSGLTLGRAALDNLKDDVSTKARNWALELSDVPSSSQLSLLNRLREQGGIQDALLMTSNGQLVGTSGSGLSELIPEVPSVAELRQARARLTFAMIEGEAGAREARHGLRARVIVLIPEPGTPSANEPATSLAPREDSKSGGGAFFSSMVPSTDARFLQLIQPVPASIATNAEALQNGYREYQELSLARQGLQTIYGLTLTLTLLLSIFAAIASSVLLASSMTAPLLQVAEGTKAVAEGNYRQVREFPGNDELNLLTQSFNAMTRQLTEARDEVETKQREVENAKAYLERVLANLSAGVVVLNKDFRLVTANHGASRILGHLLLQRADHPLHEIDAVLASALSTAFADHALTASPKDSWQQQVEVKRAPAAASALDRAQGATPAQPTAGGEPLMLLARGSRLQLDDGLGYVVVFDDITQIISAQRALAWGEVARRLAHEIKNPLTPIQLAAERLQMKLIQKLSMPDADVLKRGTAIIVNQVAAMKRMVDDFRDYARVPPARLSPLALNTLVEEVAALYGAEVSDGAIELSLRAGLPMIEGDATQLRQVIHNLLVNAQDAMLGRADARIWVRTELVEIEEANTRMRAVRLAVEDNGPGFAPNILRRAFEPYVTTKSSGTGLGLAMVKKIVDEHGARIDVVNRGTGHSGAIVTIVFRRLAEVSAVAALHAA